MDVMHPPTATVVPDEERLRLALEEAGWRFTRQRAAVFAYLRAAEIHPTAEQVFDAVRRELPHISLATIYKALEALVDTRLATRIPDSNGPARYDGRSEAHYHYRCERTGQVRDLPLDYDEHLLDKIAPELVEQLRREGFRLLGHRLELVGYFEEGNGSAADPSSASAS
jgi:Fe2+ or Zn2+ uptake regulation protein